jgi:hypothetical protein
MRKFSFSIEEVKFAGNREAMILGRCCGDEIRAGDKVSAMVLLSCENGQETIIIRELHPLTVIRVSPTFGKEIGYIPKAYSGGFMVNANDAVGLRFGWYLEGENA